MAKTNGTSKALFERQMKNKEIIARRQEQADRNLPAVEKDFSSLLDKAKELLHDQALITQDNDDIDLSSIKLTKAKADSFLDAMQNFIKISHLNSIIKADKLKFQREDEMDAMGALLMSCRSAARASEKHMALIGEQLGQAIQDMKELDEDVSVEDRQKHVELLGALGQAFRGGVETMNNVTDGLKSVIQLERWSGGRPWGNEGGAALHITNELMGDWNDKKEKKKLIAPRKLSAVEVIQMEAEGGLDDGDGDENIFDD